ncbi:MAG: RusA family crossover junction endodeoxyribonuclease [Betaproteobacteria bacterium]|nr:MAG: RusA family crossover junction endodeoxyribonuclease [Betaproteobacteria bacterium]
MKLVLAYPVSANRYWRTFAYLAKATRKPSAVTVPSEEAKAYKEECGWRAKAAGVRSPLTGAIELRFRLVPASRVCMDLDNALKVSIDALKGIVFDDDSQVYKIVAERSDPDPVGGARLEVEILPLVMPTALEAAAA